MQNLFRRADYGEKPFCSNPVGSVILRVPRSGGVVHQFQRQERAAGSGDRIRDIDRRGNGRENQSTSYALQGFAIRARDNVLNIRFNARGIAHHGERRAHYQFAIGDAVGAYADAGRSANVSGYLNARTRWNGVSRVSIRRPAL